MLGKVKISSIIASSGKKAELNTWHYYRPTKPAIKKEEHFINLKTSELEIQLNQLDEIILSIVLDFLFCPTWLVCRWLKKYSKYRTESEKDTIMSWIDIGLVWHESSVTGNYLRPTKLLFNLFNKNMPKYTDIPFNQLTHTISEQQVMFEILSGDSDNIVNKIFSKMYIKRHSPLGLTGGIKGTNIINESQFSNVISYQSKSVKEINSIEYNINKEIENKETITTEFRDFSKFIIIKKRGNTGVVKKDYSFHVPDLIIPLPRLQGSPQSIAIEVELSDKKLTRYIETLKMYKDNNRFGYVVWLSSNEKISGNLLKAFKNLSGLNKTKMLIQPFTIPSPDPILT